MGYHRNQHGRNVSRYSEPRGGEGRRTHDGTSGRIRLSPGLIVTALIVWSVPFWGAYLLVDPVLDWLAGSVGPLTDAGTGVARWLGLGQQAAVLSDMANVGGGIGWAVGPLHFIIKAGLLLVWIAGGFALIAVSAILRRRSRW
ncbi:MAG: hypothetical protein WA873_01050 [Jannaschia helgolandensis]